MRDISPERVWLAPMSGSTDAAFRRQAIRFGAEAVVSEMVAGEALTAARPDMVRRICRHEGAGRWIVQLAARRPEDMKAGARLLAEAGVDQIDINMGCPSRQVTGGQSGSALMREPDLAQRIMDAALEGGGGLPVSLKMRLGWDHDALNAPTLAQYAERAGICMVFVHGRTRCQFYKGEADWAQIADTKDAVTIPVIANGDISDPASAQQALELSGADGVMIGRAAMGRPWLLGSVSASLNNNDNWTWPDVPEQLDSLVSQIEDSLSLYGAALGLKIVRKHISAAIDHLDRPWHSDARREARSTICQLSSADAVVEALQDVYLKDRRLAA
ncbi:tRNA dihydrouridine synthase DusB [Henriciella litoralis]|uniref:tRNA dihydrouridine synthase DusB n=1 Tax=Henriciella litoralis TaxID=568102 RepID=UPI00227728D6|nr:tRNA dihydrouridine synthase DusB [Henriciella litoralis]